MPALIAAAAAAVWICSLVSTRLTLAVLNRRQILDHPNERSSHSIAVPRGLGIGVIPVVLAAWFLLGGTEARWMCAGAAVLAVMSWIDDLRDLHAGWRFIAQIGVTSAAVSIMAIPQYFGLPVLLIRAGIVFFWVAFINQVNFTDGIDGNLGTMLACVGIGLFLAVSGELGVLSLMIAAAAGGFLVWNWHPARGFMGDVGSIPLGFLLGWLLLRTIFIGQWSVAVILPLFYFADTFVTYSKRIVRVGLSLWRPHREYLYQRATATKSHSHVVLAILACNIVLICLAVVAVRGFVWQALLAALVPVVATYAYLASASK